MKKTFFISIIAILFIALFLPVYQGKAAIPTSIDVLGQVFQIQNWPSIFKIDVTNKDSDNNIKIKPQGVVDVNIVNYPPAPKTVWVWQNATSLVNGDYSPIFETNGWNKMYFDIRQTNPSLCLYHLKLLSSLDGTNWLPQKIYWYKNSSSSYTPGTYFTDDFMGDTTQNYNGSSERNESFVKASYYKFEYSQYGGTCNNETLNVYVYLTQAINSMEY